MRTISIALLALALLTAPGCTDAYTSSVTAVGQQFHVTVYSGGHAVRAYRSTGKVLTEEDSDWWYFRDKATGGLVRVTGTVTVEEAR